MKILSNGFKLPEDMDTNFFDYIRYNIQRLNDHSHDGDNSNNISPSAIVATTQRINSGWIATGGGIYYQEVTIPEPHEFDDVKIFVLDYVTRQALYPTIEKTDISTYNIYVPYSDADLEVIYG
jgi:hypothetical protein